MAARVSSTSVGVQRFSLLSENSQPCTTVSAVPSVSGRPKLVIVQAGGLAAPVSHQLPQSVAMAAKP